MRCIVSIFLLLFPPVLFAQSDAVATFLDGYANAHHYSGSILIQWHDKTRFSKSYGLANIPFNVPNTQQTRYKIASVTKLFTSVLILQLYEQHKLDLGQPIKTYLPDYAGEAGSKVSIQQLLNHTSGLPSFDAVTDQASALRDGIPVYQLPHSSDQLLTQFSSGKLIGSPGQAFNYNNADYVVLGKIIESLYHEPYEQVLKERILEPLQMNDSGVLHHGDIIDRLADTYWYPDDRKILCMDLPVYPENWYAAGAMYSTTGDLLKFADALFGARLIAPDTLKQMIKPGLDDYGDGLWSYVISAKGAKHPVVKRPGLIMGAQAQFFHVMDQDITIVMLGNTSVLDSDALVAEIAKRAIH
ncbi:MULTISPECIES: serine hydrolase domain-containing protein [unclassified Dyella]|uniref:serine hydrolase domain-containing protein n=1 Tax=unclassified Dyella TaxID=2634549 RepID=UPI000C8485BF|nr:MULTISPECIES: serine hydrolase domain-containing protein [unclassified Dyella]MDR3447969.1 serine hydrolase [Dyella sp.]PMQ03597.1 D-alanyl-D-alanine carboxypeptidase [Dyella sp. AD56]